MDLCMTGIDFVHAPLEKREAVSLVRGQVQELLPRIAAMEGVAGCVLLATCNRTELYLHGEEGAELDPLAVLAEAAGFDAAEYRGFSIQRTENEAVHHLMQVAAGLESQIFGDDQIVSQVKGAVALAREARVLRQRVHARRVRDAGQQRAFVGIERAGGFAEITPARTADALVAVAEVDGVHV